MHAVRADKNSKRHFCLGVFGSAPPGVPPCHPPAATTRPWCARASRARRQHPPERTGARAAAQRCSHCGWTGPAGWGRGGSARGGAARGKLGGWSAHRMANAQRCRPLKRQHVLPGGVVPGHHVDLLGLVPQFAHRHRRLVVLPGGLAMLPTVRLCTALATWAPLCLSAAVARRGPRPTALPAVRRPIRW